MNPCRFIRAEHSNWQQGSARDGCYSRPGVPRKTVTKPAEKIVPGHFVHRGSVLPNHSLRRLRNVRFFSARVGQMTAKLTQGTATGTNRSEAPK